jgi:hypothetical protein
MKALKPKASEYIRRAIEERLSRKRGAKSRGKK